jgi:asparagine synthase (glutamine-hydrolysing)
MNARVQYSGRRDILCGIAGYYGQENLSLLKKMLYCIRYRGPDDQGIFTDENVGLGIRRLAIVDVKLGKQPIYNEDKTLSIVLNGEIYNFNELRNQLRSLGHTFLTDTDTEVVIHAYEEWGESCLQKLNGMFAFAIWSKRNKSLFIARDRLGEKPLYYHYSMNRLLFASEIKALLVDQNIAKEPNNPAVLSYLLTGFQYTDETFFKSIKELQPGHYMIVNSEGLKSVKYWDIPKEKSHQREILKDQFSNGSTIGQFLALLLDAINTRIPSDFSITYYLSGGLDSSAIVCLANKIIETRISKRKEENTILTASYATKWDEAPYAEEVGRFLGADITYVFPSSVVTWEDLKAFVYHMDEPVAVLNYYAYWCLAKVTKSESKIIFMGQGPDEFLGGHVQHAISYLRELATEGKMQKALSELVRGVKTRETVAVMHQITANFVSKFKSALITSQIDKKFLSLYKKTVDMGLKSHSLRESLIRDVKQEKLPMHLRVGDRMSSAFSLELRCPFLDHRLIEYSFMLPSDYKIRGGATKYVLREAVKEAVPESAIRRRKMGTPVPADDWLKKFGPEITQMIKSRRFVNRGYFNAGVVQNLYERYCKDKMNQYEKRIFRDALWRIINLELWFEVFFDRQN